VVGFRCESLGAVGFLTLLSNIALHLTKDPMSFHSGRTFQSFHDVRPRKSEFGPLANEGGIR
jgi:hypothetical protein